VNYVTLLIAVVILFHHSYRFFVAINNHSMKRNILTFVLLAILMAVVFIAFAQQGNPSEKNASVDLPKFYHARIGPMATSLKHDFNRDMIDLKTSLQNMPKEKLNP
jgi:hypothetical protein